MNVNEIHVPTHDEIEAQIRAARRQQGLAVAAMVKAALRWLSHPHLAHRHA